MEEGSLEKQIEYLKKLFSDVSKQLEELLPDKTRNRIGDYDSDYSLQVNEKEDKESEDYVPINFDFKHSFWVEEEEKKPEPTKEIPKVKQLDIAGGVIASFVNPFDNDLSKNIGVRIRRVPKEVLGYRVLGRAFPGMNLIEIVDTLEGDEFEEVKLHELLHIQDPFASEYNIRARTRDLLRKTKWD
jgi:hypothetical protein